MQTPREPNASLPEQIGQLRDQHTRLVTTGPFLPEDAAPWAATVEAVDFHLSRAADRCRHDAALTDAHVRQARMAACRLEEMAAEPLTEDEQARAFAMVSDQIGDESHKDRVWAYLESAGVVGIREELAEQAAYLAEEGAD